ncbi:MAG: hypothetical protein P8M16_07285 [Acidimicrobiales bacterium]|nr:hypothetical protein [Acidimicrobiales bacterium]
MNTELLMVIGAAVYGLTLWGLLVAGYSITTSAADKGQSTTEDNKLENGLADSSGKGGLGSKLRGTLVRLARRSSGF